MSDSPGRERRPQRAPQVEAAALGYDRGQDAAPRVLAKGRGEIAENILARADAHAIPVERDPDLLQCLAPLQVGDNIPVEAYAAVAQVLAFLYRENREF